jgi:hypothetical protein
MSSVAVYRLARFPDGWGAEYYDWQTNHMNGNYGDIKGPGVDANTFTAQVPQTSAVTHSMDYIKNPTDAQLKSTVEQTSQIVKQYANRIKIWEIGNEWWRERGGEKNLQVRAVDLTRYAKLVAAVAPAMKQAAQSVGQNIEVFATVDWTAPDESSTLVSKVQAIDGKAWNSVDGISVHTYVGMTTEPHLSKLSPCLSKIAAATQRNNFYASEWSVTARRTRDDYGIRNANYTALALQSMVLAGITRGCYWPPMLNVQDTIFVSDNYQQPYATGLLYGWMSQYYEGQALATSGTMSAAAARLNGGVNIIVPSQNSGLRHIQIPLSGVGLSHVVSAQVMYSDNPDDQQLSRIVKVVPLPTFITVDNTSACPRLMLNFYLNPGTANRGSNWEIARISLN